MAEFVAMEPINIAIEIAAMVFRLRKCIDSVLRLMEQRTRPLRGSEGGFVADRIAPSIGPFHIPRE